MKWAAAPAKAILFIDMENRLVDFQSDAKWRMSEKKKPIQTDMWKLRVYLPTCIYWPVNGRELVRKRIYEKQ